MPGIFNIPEIVINHDEPLVKTGINYFIDYINCLEGLKTKIKNLHWSAKILPSQDKRGAHLYLDDYLETVSDFQDKVAEGSMGALNTVIPIDCVQGTTCSCTSTKELIEYVRSRTLDFYVNMPEGALFAGLKSETEVFIQETNNFGYRFNLTD